MHEGVLRYIDPSVPVAYFCKSDVRGDDWNDSPWEYNSGYPYSYLTRVVYLDDNFTLAGGGGRDSVWSVDDINGGAVAWLSDPVHGIFIPAGVDVEHFVKLVQAGGGIAIVVPDGRDEQ